MGVILKPTKRAKERILIYGGGGTGKTYDALTVAHRTLGSGQTLWVLDTDNSVTTLLEEIDTFAGLGIAFDGHNVGGSRVQWEHDDTFPVEDGGKVCIYHATTWDEACAGLAEIVDQAGPQDWVLIDSVSQLWTWVQEWFVKKTHGEDMAEWLVDWRIEQLKDGKAGNQEAQALLADGAWTFINAQWKKHVTELCLNPPCHLFITAEAKTLRSDGKDQKAVRVMYDAIGAKPEGQWALGHKMKTVLFKDKTRGANPVRRTTTVKDWGREDRMLDEDEIADFAMGYLKNVAGWRLEKEG